MTGAFMTTVGDPWFPEAKLMFSSPRCKRNTYKGLVRLVLEYGSSVWDPQV